MDVITIETAKIRNSRVGFYLFIQVFFAKTIPLLPDLYYLYTNYLYGEGKISVCTLYTISIHCTIDKVDFNR